MNLAKLVATSLMEFQFKLQSKIKLKLEQFDLGFKMSNRVQMDKHTKLFNKQMERSMISMHKVTDISILIGRDSRAPSKMLMFRTSSGTGRRAI